jgi:hypothetical protein
MPWKVVGHSRRETFVRHTTTMATRGGRLEQGEELDGGVLCPGTMEMGQEYHGKWSKPWLQRFKAEGWLVVVDTPVMHG